MNKKSLLPLLALAILPVLAINMMYEINADKIGKQFAADNPGATIMVHTLEAAATEKEEIRRAQLIVQGTVLEAKPYWKITYEGSKPKIYTEFSVRVEETIKGYVFGDTIKVVMSGGTLDGITMKTEAVKLIEDTQVILLLGKDIGSIFGDAYSPVSVSKSIYIIEDGQAKNHQSDRTDNLDKVKERISAQI